VPLERKNSRLGSGTKYFVTCPSYFAIRDLSLLHVINAQKQFELNLYGADPNIEMTDELRCVSQGFSHKVKKYEKDDVNEYRFHTEFHQKSRPNAKTVNTGVFTKGADGFDYYGRLENVYELMFNQTNIELNLVVFKCHWFDPHSGQRITPSIGLVEVRHSTTYSGVDVFVVAHQAKQVYYLPYPCQNVELNGWEVMFQVSDDPQV
jgi:hypothetical protein